jgi:hypothetical protein
MFRRRKGEKMEPRISKELGLDPPKPPRNPILDRAVQAIGSLLLVFVYSAPLQLILYSGLMGGIEAAHRHDPAWLGVIVGCGFGLAVVAILWMAEGGSSCTWLELGIPCAVVLVLMLVLLPIFIQARDKAQAHQKVAQRTAIKT